jgi:hypothetical protein
MHLVPITLIAAELNETTDTLAARLGDSITTDPIPGYAASPPNTAAN